MDFMSQPKHLLTTSSRQFFCIHINNCFLSNWKTDSYTSKMHHIPYPIHYIISTSYTPHHIHYFICGVLHNLLTVELCRWDFLTCVEILFLLDFDIHKIYFLFFVFNSTFLLENYTIVKENVPYTILCYIHICSTSYIIHHIHHIKQDHVMIDVLWHIIVLTFTKMFSSHQKKNFHHNLFFTSHQKILFSSTTTNFFGIPKKIHHFFSSWKISFRKLTVYITSYIP